MIPKSKHFLTCLLAPTRGQGVVTLLLTLIATTGALAFAALPASAQGTVASDTKAADTKAVDTTVVDTTVDAKAVEIAKKTLDAMGGADAWSSTRFLRFEFFGFRLHHWDRYTGRHRLEGKTREGQSYVVLHDINDQGKGGGQAWLDGKPLEGEALAEWLERAYGAWVNDAYWLIMPYKLLDPGVHLTYEGEEALDDTTYDKLKLTFDHVGQTPGDTYWAYIDRATGLMGRWAYVLESFEAGQAATSWRWLDWQTYGGIKLSSRRVGVENEREAMLGQIAVFDDLPDAAFTSRDFSSTSPASE